MKKILLVTAVLFFAFFFTSESKANPGGYGYFYTSLAPHGEWIELDNGVTVWRPGGIRNDWAPYRDGEWVWTADGWYWNSYEPFGYITYHYGRWYNDDYYGWIWVPDDQWGPAWVEWRYDDDYIGWAPLPPYAVFSVNVGLHFSYDYHTPYNHWHFVKYRYFCDPFVSNYYVGPTYRYRIFNHTKYRTDYVYEGGRVVNRGVDIDVIRRRTGMNIREREIVRTSDPREIGRNNGRNNDKIRTFVATNDELRQDARNVEIKRSDRRTTLETSKVEFGRRTDTEKRNAVDNSRPVERVGADNNRNNREGIRNTTPETNKREGVRNTTPETNRREDVRNANPERNKREGIQNTNPPRRETIQNTKPEINKRENVRNTAPEPNRQPRVERRVESAPRERRVEQPREQKRNEPQQRVEKRGGNERNAGAEKRDRRDR